MSSLAPRLRRAGAGAAVLLLLFTGVACGDSDSGGNPVGNNGNVNAPGNPTDTKASNDGGDNYAPGDTAVPGQPNTGEESGGGVSGSGNGTGGGSGSAGGSGGAG